MGHLVLTSRDGPERSFPLSKDSSTLGRHRNNDIVISDPKVSAFHSRIDRTAEGFVLVDLESRNGSFVNGRKVRKMLLKNDDVEFVGELQKHNVLVVPGRGFGMPGYFRISYCVEDRTLEGALPGFRAAIDRYG